MRLIDNSDFKGVSMCRLFDNDKLKWFVKFKYFQHVSNIEYLELVKGRGFIYQLKANGLYKQTGARHTKKSYLIEDIFSFLKINQNADEYSKMILKLPIDTFFEIEKNCKDNDIHIKGEKVYLEYLHSIIKGIVDVKYQYSALEYKIDMFISDLNIAIEFDEPHHTKYLDQDKERENKIQGYLGCEFFRIDERYDIIDQIEKIATIIIERKTGILQNMNSNFITKEFENLFIDFIDDFPLYFKLRNLASVEKEAIIGLTLFDKNKIEKLESNLAFSINMGYIKTFDSLIDELRKLYDKKKKQIL